MARDGVHTGASDARLTDLLRADTVTAYQALLELRARHQPSVLAYARRCTAGEATARQLAAQVFTLAARETARGIDPGVPWRHRLLLLAARVAGEWAADERAAGLDAGLLLVLNTAAPGGPVPPLLGAFQSLPARTQGLVWYGVVEDQPVPRTAAFLGVRDEDVVHGTEQALRTLARTCLRFRLAASDDPGCADFSRLVEEAVRPDGPRPSADLHAHMLHCPHCATAYEEQCALRDAPRPALAEGLLPWGGAGYAGRTPEPTPVPPTAPSVGWSRPRRLVLASAALGVALVPLLLFLLAQGGSSSGEPESAGAAVTTPAGPPPVTVTATATVSPTAAGSVSPSPTRTPASPTPTKSARPTPPPFRPPGGTYAQVVNVATGRCLDVSGALAEGTDVDTAPCDTDRRTQLWRTDTARGVLQSAADPDFCLDSRGDVDKGLGIWSCDSVDGSHGDNLRFTVDTDGVIRPAIAIATAVTPANDGDGVSLERLTGGTEQRWRAGSS